MRHLARLNIHHSITFDMAHPHSLVIGAGLCGTLLAIRLAQRGHRVTLVEKRPDMRTVEQAAGRSINLALSDRGLQSLRMVGMEDHVRELCIPMHGRMIHPESGNAFFSPYSGREGEYINSVSRGGLNMALLDKAEATEGLSLLFNSPCRGVDLAAGTATFTDAPSGTDFSIDADLIFGTDGAGSAVRQSMMNNSATLRFDFSQDWLPHGYKELTIPPAKDGSYRIEKHALHIWPRGTYMVIALPNLDGSFTVTLFRPYADRPYGFDALDSDEKILAFFEEKFPDALRHMPDLLADYHGNPTSPLGTIKCYPWAAHNTSLLLGDSAHAIVPFYGQGMNAAFEDVFVLDQFLDRHDGQWGKAFDAFQAHRKKDADAIADLAKDNFYEMRDHVDDPAFIKKRKLETALEHTFPDYYSKYSMVTFNEEMRYSDAMMKGRAQDKWLLDQVSEVDSVEQLDIESVYKRMKEWEQ